MPYSTPYPQCIFCGAKADSREHAIPKWISKQLGIKAMLTPNAAAVLTGDTKELPRRKQPISFASLRARIFCKGCNTHFKHLEDAAMPLLVAMARGQQLILTPDQQSLLALWAGKTAIALIAATAPSLLPLVPMEHRRAIRERGVLNDEAWVGYCAWRGATTLVCSHVTEDDLTPTQGNEGTVVIFAFGPIAFKIVDLVHPLRPSEIMDTDWKDFPQFWPRLPTAVKWPPDGDAIAGDELAGLLRSSPTRDR